MFFRVPGKKWERVKTRNMERMNSMRDWGKRSLEGSGAEDDQQQPERKRPVLARYGLINN